MLSVKRTNSEDTDFRHLVSELDAFLKHLDGDDHAFYAQFNKIDVLKHAVVVYLNGEAVGCGAVKEFSPEALEVKRMYVPPQHRKKGVASAVLTELEKWAVEMNYPKCVLETGKRQPDAIALYLKNGYRIIPNFAPYDVDENSVCFEKEV